MDKKPLGIKCYGHIPHLPGSRVGKGDHKCDIHQAITATQKVRDKFDRVIVQEKVDGSNMGVAKLEGVILPLMRSGYLANSSPFEMHHHFANWVYSNQSRFDAVLKEGERLCGEWLMQAHGTIYNLSHEPFVVFDLMKKDRRVTFYELCYRVKDYGFVTPHTISIGPALSIEDAMDRLACSGHGAVDPVEGAVWRVERNELTHPGQTGDRDWIVNFLVKYVRPDKEDGKYLPEISGREAIWNWRPK